MKEKNLPVSCVYCESGPPLAVLIQKSFQTFLRKEQLAPDLQASKQHDHE